MNNFLFSNFSSLLIDITHTDRGMQYAMFRKTIIKAGQGVNRGTGIGLLLFV
jgi:hypothetical protein